MYSVTFDSLFILLYLFFTCEMTAVRDSPMTRYSTLRFAPRKEEARSALDPNPTNKT